MEKYLTVRETAEAWGVSERSVRGYCESGRVDGARREGKAWMIPEGAKPPRRKNGSGFPLLGVLQREQEARLPGGIYHWVQVEFAYNSNHMEGSRLTHEQTRYIFETATVDAAGGCVSADDVVETANHFQCTDLVIRNAGKKLSEEFILKLHAVLKNGTSDTRRSWFSVGAYKRLPNTVGGVFTASPEETPARMRGLLAEYGGKAHPDLDDLLDFHCRFERIHPFQDGNGRVGRLILFKECLKNGIVPFIIDEELKYLYYRGLAQWDSERGFLRDTCLTAQDRFRQCMDRFRIPY